MNPIIRIRPLHFVDILCDYGAGVDEFEPHPYGHAVHTVANTMLRDRETMLEITLEPDDICQPCVHNIDGVCDNLIDRSYRPSAPALMREWDLLINQRWCERLGIGEGERYTAGELCVRLRNRAGDITELFPEIIDDRIIKKERNMREGIKKFME